MNDYKRINVSLTRARYGIFVIGNYYFLFLDEGMTESGAGEGDKRSGDESKSHPEAKRTSEWRKTLWTMVGGHEVPDKLTAEEEKSSWQQLPDCDDSAVVSSRVYVPALATSLIATL